MKKTALLIMAVVGVGTVLVPGRAGAADLIDTNIVGAVNTTASDAWVISDTTAANYVITGSTISSAPGSNRVWIASPTNAVSYSSLGRGGLMSSWTAPHNVTVTDSTITGSDGGDMSVVSNVIGSFKFFADGGDGMLLKNVNGVFNNATIAGGNGGKIIAPYAGQSTATAGFGLTLQGTSTLHATNSIFEGGKGGQIDNHPNTGNAVGGDGIVVTNATVVLDFSDDTQVIGGDGGSVSVDKYSKGKADGGNALLVNARSVTTDLTIKGGTFVGGKAGTVAGKTMQDGKSIYLAGSRRVNLTLEGGNFDDGILIANTYASTLALKSTFTNDAPLLFKGETLKITEWTDGQLSDVTLSGSYVVSIELAGTNEFNLYGRFIVGEYGRAIFSSGLVVKSGGTLNLGTPRIANEAKFVHTETNSTIISPYYGGTYMGTLKSSGSLTLDAGTEWIIKDTGTIPAASGSTFDLATAEGELTSHLIASDVHYVTTKAFPDYYLTITDIVTTGSTVRVTCAERDLIDNDSDGLDDEQELYYYGTSPSTTDSDNDGLSDGEEINLGTDPLKSDSDNDGLSDGEEINLGTDPLKSDSDNDGLSDGDEINLGTDPFDVDSDKDNLADGYEVNTFGTNPLLYDTNGDGYSDSTLFVRQNNGTNANAPYNHWTSAATNIQDALQYAEDNCTILVDDGNYLLNNTIVVSKQVTIQSLNGPKKTIINGQGSVRCFNLGNTACVIEGLTITNGYYSGSGGGIYCSDTTPVVTNCILSGNSASSYGGGMYYGTANNCILSGNTASSSGGGIYYGTANHCTLSGNSADYGGGMCSGTANNCILSGNSADYGGGMCSGTANNCILSGNSASQYGGGMYSGTANNCIIYYNKAVNGNDLRNTTAFYSCSSDGMHGADGNITNAPMLVSTSHISVDSPCRGAGSLEYAAGTDIDGEAWANPPSMGCDEPSGTILRGNLSVGMVNEDNSAVSGYAIRFLGVVAGNASMHVWDFGDGTWVTNTLSVQHDWNIPGSYEVVLTAYNADWPDGVSATQVVEVVDGDEWAMHVSPDGDDANDGLGWETAKATIQSGVSECYSGGRVLVGSGTYALTNEIVVDKAIRIIGINGPESTVVNGQGSVRCFNLGNSACVLEGLTLTNGFSSEDGGGIYCIGTLPVVTNCILSGNSARYGGGMVGGTANNCILSGNTASRGGGMYDGTANHCTIIGNSAGYGGGMYYGTANNCTISGNSASQHGGGMYGGDGLGTAIGTANNCTISRNTAFYFGGGMYYGTANHCTISGNSAGDGGGMYKGTANNSIIYYNKANYGNDFRYTTASYSCSPDVVHGVNGNITNAPMRVSTSHIAADSPCRGAGSARYAGGTDIDGEAWANPPSMGCDEPSDSPFGSILVGIDPPETLQIVGFSTRFIGDIEGAISMHVWNFGDGTRVTNSVVVEHTWSTTGTYDVVLTAYNTDWPDGVSATQQIVIASAEDMAIYVSPDGDDMNDGTSWTSAKATIQVGVDAQNIVNGWVIVGAGTYSLSSTISVSKPIRIVGADGPDTTIVDGQGTVRCFNLGNSACVVEGMTITNGYSSERGGGIYCSGKTPVVINCTISGNRAYYYGGGMVNGTASHCTISGNSAGDGGGMYYGTANHCILSENSSGGSGGGMYYVTANNCTISGNSARYGGGMYNGTANNCTIRGNTASSYGGGMVQGTANNSIVWYNTSPSGKDLYNTTARYSCSPDVTHGVNGNITTSPMFMDAANGDYRLAAGSPCIDVGQNGYVVGSHDLAGLPRILGGVVDMGAYEYYNENDDEDDDGMPNWWEATHFGSILGSAPTDDFDNDLFDNISEWIAGTNPSDPNSVFVVSVSTNQIPTGFVIEWTSVEDRTYSVLWGRTLTNACEVLQDGIEYPQNSYTDTVHAVESTGFYRVEVRMP